MDRTFFVVAGVLEIAALALVVGLWRGRESPWRQVLWTAVLLVPFFGLIAYAVLHDTPPPSDPADRAPDRPDIWGGPDGSCSR